MNFLQEIDRFNYLNSFNIEKSLNPNLISIYDLHDLLKSGYTIVNVDSDYIEKSEKDLSHLIKKEVWVVRGNQRYKQTVYVRKEDEEEIETPIGGELSPTVKGLEIEKYSDKAVLIKGDTYANIDLMRKIKEETGFGSWNGKLKGWIFGLNQIDKILGLVWSDVKDKDEDKAQAIQNQKNASLVEGDKIEVNGLEGEVKKNVSDSEGIKYDVKLNDGTELKSVNEKTIETTPLTDDKKISEVINNAQPENRAKTEKQLYGLKSIKDYHSYSLSELLSIHGIQQEEIYKIIDAFKNPKTKEDAGKRASSGGVNKEYTDKTQIEGLTKRQLIGKLVYLHYQAVKKAIEDGLELKPEALELYSELKETYSKKRQAMSEETKRKISEALKKYKEEEAKKAAQDFINSLSTETINELKESFKSAVNKEVLNQQSELSNLIEEKAKLAKEKQDLRDKTKTDTNYSYTSEEDRQKIHDLSRKIVDTDNRIRNKNNVIQAISNGGDIMAFTDQTGIKHKEISDFTRVNTSNITYDIDTILTDEKPKYIPEINEDVFRQKGFILDAIRIDKNTYMVATNGHSEQGEFKGFNSKTQKNEYEGYNSDAAGYVILSLDQLVLTNDYYITKQKAKYKEEADRKNQKQRDYWFKMTEKQKEYYYNQKNFYESMPVAIKKKISKEEWDKLSLIEKEKIYIPVKKYNPEKLKSKLEEGYMWTSFHTMYERFVDINAKRTKGGRALELNETSPGSYGNPKVFSSWHDFSEMLNWKMNDINIQREIESDMRKSALETSFGESNTNDSLKKDYGILVKRQNGDNISPLEIDQLKNAWESVNKSFGGLKENAREDNLKLSHSGNKFIFASKASGMYVSDMKTIAVTNKYGEDQMGFTLGHEVAHWIDHVIGRKENGRHASDDFESTAGRIAIEFRRNLNKKTDSKYTNSTNECFARAMELYHANETMGDKANVVGVNYFAAPDYVNKNTYESKIKPLIQQFLQENKEILKGSIFDIMK